MAILIRLAGMLAIILFSTKLQGRSRVVSERMSKLSSASRLTLLVRLVRDSRTPVWLRGLLLLPAAYVVSPIDLIPDFIPFIGGMDDVAVFGIVAGFVARFAPEGLLENYLDELSGTQAPQPPRPPRR